MGGGEADEAGPEGGAEDARPRLVSNHAPVGWDDRPFSPANEPPGPWEHLCARHPAVAGLVLGSLSVLTLAVPPGLHRPWWSLALMAVVWFVVWPAVNTWLWRAGGRRRREYDRRLRASVGGAATLDG